jgi:trehalose 6-phosphate phosphatase
VLDVDATVALLAQQPRATVLLVDFDGSLSRIVDHPDDARPLPEVVSVLTALVAILGRVGVVSGRPVEFLAAHLPVPGLTLVGQYGLESYADGVLTVDPRTQPYLDRIAEAATRAETRLPGIYVERKGTTAITLHWRTASDRAEEVNAAASDLAAQFGLDAPQRGRKAVELRPPVPVDKGTVVAQLVAGFAVGAFAGDDLGDVPAFMALKRCVDTGQLERAVRIGVSSPEAPPELRAAVDLLVDGPEGLLALLTAVVERAGD